MINEKVGFKRPTTRYRKNSVLCGVLLSSTAQYISCVGRSFVLLGVARGKKEKGPRLTFDP